MNYLNKLVRILDTNPVYHRRTGRVIKVLPDNTLHVQFVGGTLVGGGFTPEMVEVIQEENSGFGSNQIAKLANRLKDDMECWTNEALVAYNITKAQQERKIKKQLNG